MLIKLNILSIVVLLTISTSGQILSVSDSSGYKRAVQELKMSLTDSTQHNVINTTSSILDTKENAIKFAELILFDTYGKKQIEKEKPYKTFNIDGFWIISGTLPKGWLGGTFLIIIDSHNCKIIRLTHGK